MALGHEATDSTAQGQDEAQQQGNGAYRPEQDGGEDGVSQEVIEVQGRGIFGSAWGGIVAVVAVVVIALLLSESWKLSSYTFHHQQSS